MHGRRVGARAPELLRSDDLEYVTLTVGEAVQPRAGPETVFPFLEPNTATTLTLLLKHFEGLALLDDKRGFADVEAATPHTTVRLGPATDCGHVLRYADSNWELPSRLLDGEREQPHRQLDHHESILTQPVHHGTRVNGNLTQLAQFIQCALAARAGTVTAICGPSGCAFETCQMWRQAEQM